MTQGNIIIFTVTSSLYGDNNARTYLKIRKIKINHNKSLINNTNDKKNKTYYFVVGNGKGPRLMTQIAILLLLWYVAI